MARPRRTDEVDTRERLLDAAEEAFGAHGFERARLEDVAARAGIQRPSLLYHFPSKDDLYREVVHRTFARLGDSLADALRAPRPLAERLDAATAVWLDRLETNPAIARIVLRELVDQRGPGVALVFQEVGPLLDRLEGMLSTALPGAPGSGPGLRAALLQIATAALVRSAAGPLAPVLWGETDRTRDLVRILFQGALQGAPNDPEPPSPKEP